ncbi:ABC transporter substrate-binding protein [Syntrophomonas wolfei]|jgi:iron complex transport system substrate-binding protein|uniref:ABC transporter substrate-binding protein n=1 Tax=Syntrophomonas wolfei TaxID=863 RepID=UPI0007730A15|nr:ABC transporter substrate-binding protein [Syntrophomonas wolfei]
MKKKRFGLLLVMVFFLALSVMFIAGCGKEKAADMPDATRKIVDMAGREVTLPLEINRIVTLGPVPVINSLIFTVGEGDKIVNGLPEFARNERYKYQHKFAPNITNQPMLQMSTGKPNVEELLKLKPDVVFTMSTKKAWDEQTAKVLTEAGLSTVYLVWTNPEEVKQAINLVGQALNQEKCAREYNKYFDDTVVRINDVVKSIPRNEQPRVLHCNTQNMTAPHAISDWWIKQAGGISVTEDFRKETHVAENIELSVEQLLKWNPQVIIVGSPEQVDSLFNDTRFKDISAVKNRRVFASPMGAQEWCYRTSEQPLMLLWAAKTFHPEVFKDLNLEEELIQFYKHFFNYSMSVEEAQEILGGGPKVDTGKKE